MHNARVLLAITLASVGCVSLAPEYQTRSVIMMAVLRAQSGLSANTDSSGLTLREEKGCYSGKLVSWRIVGDSIGATVTAIHVHAGTPALPGRLLYSVPVERSKWDPPTLLSQNSGSDPYDYEGLYAGPLAFDDLYAAIRDGPVCLDVHTTSNTVPALVAPAHLSAAYSLPDWHTYHCGST